MSCVVYHPAYSMGFFGLERLHPFDTRKFARAWKLLRPHLPQGGHVRPPRPASREELLEVHSAAYLDRLRDSRYLAEVLELPPVRFLPHWLIDACVLKPMRWATMGTVVATREALQRGFAVNLGGGYHHAKPNGGEGFCVYADIALAIHAARREGHLAEHERVVYVDLDAHQGNGVSHAFLDDPRVLLFDAFNRAIYPASDTVGRERVDCALPLPAGCSERDYLSAVHRNLPEFLDAAAEEGPIGLAIYNAGTDVYEHDSLGGLQVSASGIRARDAFVVSELRQRAVPTAFLLSGGYSRESYRIVADSILGLLDPPLPQPQFARA